jgi:hypothetical protein
MNLLLINETDVEALLKGLQFTIITPTESFFWGFVRDNIIALHCYHWIHLRHGSRRPV